MAQPTSATDGSAVSQRSTPIVSEKLAGLNLQVPQAAPVVTGTLDPWQQNLNARVRYAQMTDPWALNLFARQSHRDSEHLTVGQTPTVAVVSTGGFDWADAGIGAAFAVGTMLLGAAVVVTIRRHYGPLAH